jgi:hypothetical protein
MSCTGGFEDEDEKFCSAKTSRRHVLRMCDLIRRSEQAGYNLVLVIESNKGQIFRQDTGLRVDEEWDVGAVAAAIHLASGRILKSWEDSHVR